VRPGTSLREGEEEEEEEEVPWGHVTLAMRWATWPETVHCLQSFWRLKGYLQQQKGTGGNLPPSLRTPSPHAGMARPAQPSNDDKWVADTGASQHLTGNLALLHNYVAYDQPVQVDVPGAQTNMLGHGTVYFRGPEGEGHFRLENVGYLPGSRGLMSLGKMHKANFSTITSR